MQRFLVIVMGWMGILSQVLADAAPAAPAATNGMGSNALTQGLMLGAFVLIFYFLILRPQSKRAKEHRQLVLGMQKGDEIITSGGIAGKITRVTDNFFIIEIANGVEVPVQRQAVVSSLPKGTLKSL